MTALAALCGAAVGFGVLLIASGVRGVEVPLIRQPRSFAGVEQRLVRVAVAIATGVVVGLATGWPVGALLAAAATLSLPALFGERAAHATQIARIEAVAGWAEMLRDTMAGAAGLEQAIGATATVAPAPIRGEVVALAARLERERLVPALRAFADDLADPASDLVVAALVLAAEHPAHRLGELLSSLALAAREQAAMRLRVDAGRARSRTSVKVIVGVTLALAVGLAVLNHTYLEPYDSSLGQLMLFFVGVLFACAFVWLARLTRPTQPARLLASTELES